MKTPLEIHLLGPVEIIHQNQPLKISRRIERAILYFLAVEHQPVTRTTLIDLLWPEAEQVDPRGALRTALSRLRNELPEPDLLITELDQVRLDFDRCEIDLLRFKNFYQSLQNILKAFPENLTLPAQIVQQINEALALWHGNAIIDGDNLSNYTKFENWRLSHNRELGQQRKFLIEKLIKHYQAAGRPELALEFLFLLGRIYVLDVQIQLSLLDMLITLGRHQESIDYCDSLEDIYEQNYNMPLPDEIIERCQFVQQQVDTCDKQNLNDWPQPLSMQLQLVGRQSELDQLIRAFFRGGVVFIQGELGSGKTRLIQALFQTLTPRPALFIAPSREMENSLPFSPIIHCLRQHVPEQIWNEIDSLWVNQLSLLLPELATLNKDADQPSISKLPSGKQHLFDAIHHLFQFTAKKLGRVLFFLDDAHWADVQTLQALSYLVSQGFFDHHGLLIIATRPEEPNGDLGAMIDQLDHYHSLDTVNLSGLNPNNLRNLVTQVITEMPSTRFVDQLFRETNGNPFLALEIIRDILENPGSLESYETTRLPLPASVYAVIRRRLNQLDENARNILVCAAVIGDAFSLTALQSIADFNDSADISKIDPLIKAGFIHPTKEDNPRLPNLHFAHEKMREVVLKEATTTQLQILHLRVANQLAKQRQAISKSAIIADHYLSGGDIKNAYRWFLKAAKYVWTLGAREDVLYSYEQAERLLKNAPEGYFKTYDNFLLYQQWSEFAYESNQQDLLEEVGLKIQYLGEREKNPLFMGISYIALANACFLRMQFDAGSGLVNKAIEQLEFTDNRRAMVQALLRKSTIHWWKLEFDEALSASNEIQSINETIESDSPRMLSLVFNAKQMTAMTYYAKGDAHNALDYAQETYQLYFHQLNSFDRLRALHMLAYAHFISGNYEKCERFITEGLEISRALENTFVEELLLMILSRTEEVKGYLDQAYKNANMALELGEKNGHIHTIVNANCVLGDIFSTLHNFTQATYHYRVAQIRQSFATPSIHSMMNNTHLARMLMLTNNFKEAREILQETLEITERTGMGQFYARALLVSGLCDLHEHNYPEAEIKFKLTESLAAQNGLYLEAVWVKHELVRLAMAKNQFDEAEQILNDALTESRSRHMVWFTLSGLHLGTQIHEAKQDSSIDEYHSRFDSLFRKLETYAQTEPLRQDFHNAKRYWEEGHSLT